ncbi:MAG: hypothetical protein HXX80_01315 [Nitrososphaerales archaeon]|nr:hypothetical protein [Nitrososphaerales archaeon]
MKFVLTCYFRHLKEVFEKAGIKVTVENKQEIDRLIHSIVGVGYKNCPATGREVKKRIAEDEKGFVSKLKEAWSKRI